MIFIEQPIKGVFLIRPEKIEDQRGFFTRIWCEREFARHGLVTDFVQHNLSRSFSKGTIRGLHFQIHPNQETKVIRCLKGSLYDVVIDMRNDSATRGQWLGVTLTSTSYEMLYIPAGLAHGYQAIEDDTEVFYPVSNFYNSESERGVRWNDPAFSIDWPITDNVILSEKDQNWPLYRGSDVPSLDAISNRTEELI